MKYIIGDIVKHLTNETLIVLATKDLALTSENLKKLNGEVLIKEIDKIAKTGLYVSAGFDYKLSRIKSYIDKYCILDNDFKFLDVFESDLTR